MAFVNFYEKIQQKKASKHFNKNIQKIFKKVIFSKALNTFMDFDTKLHDIFYCVYFS